VRPLHSQGGRNVHGRVTTRHQGGGHKRAYRLIDFKRTTRTACRPRSRTSSTTRTARAHRAAALRGRREALHPRPAASGRRPGRKRPGPTSSRATPAAAHIPTGTVVHNIELRPGGGGKIARSAGLGRPAPGQGGRLRPAADALRRDPAGRRDCRATVGEVGNAEQGNIKLGKAGRNRWKGKRPQVRGVAMNPVDHPLGGGEGKSSGGRHPVSPWGQPEGRTRQAHKPSDRLISRRRGRNKR
jgi:large subunit ribosomal protein L2